MLPLSPSTRPSHCRAQTLVAAGMTRWSRTAPPGTRDEMLFTNGCIICISWSSSIVLPNQNKVHPMRARKKFNSIIIIIIIIWSQLCKAVRE